MEYDSGSNVSVSYPKTHSLAQTVLGSLGDEPIGYSILACALAIGRMSNPERRLSKEEEMKFIQSIMEFVEAYWVEGGVN